MENVVDVSRWYVVYTKSKEEDRVHQNLAAGEIETFFPKFRQKQVNPFSGKAVYFRRALFPRYLFTRFSINSQMHKILYTRGVKNVVSFNDTPVPVEDDIINLIRSRVDQDGFVQFNDDLKPGDQVVVDQGSMCGITGIFDRALNNENRIMILLGAINYQASVIVDRASVRKLTFSHCN